MHCTKPKLLVVDELGYLAFEANAAHLFFQLVSRRYERGLMLMTSNRSVAEWGAVFGDAVVATAILDRLPHHSHGIRGDSYRLRSKRRAGLIGQAATASALTTDERDWGVLMSPGGQFLMSLDTAGPLHPPPTRRGRL